MSKTLIKARSLKEMKEQWRQECRRFYGLSWTKRSSSRVDKHLGTTRMNPT